MPVGRARAGLAAGTGPRPGGAADGPRLGAAGSRGGRLPPHSPVELVAALAAVGEVHEALHGSVALRSSAGAAAAPPRRAGARPAAERSAARRVPGRAAAPSRRYHGNRQQRSSGGVTPKGFPRRERGAAADPPGKGGGARHGPSGPAPRSARGQG